MGCGMNLIRTLSLCVEGILWNRRAMLPEVNIPSNLAKIYERM